MGISRSNLDQIRNALNPLDIIREAVPTLKQSGNRWRGLCPFHNERTPSFFFMPDKGLWHCFGACQEGGDVFKFVMRLDNLTFSEALRQLAQRAGVRVEWERTGDAASRESQERDRLLDLLAEAAAFYHDALRKLAEAEPARRHLSKRKIRPETVDKFQLGYAPQSNGFLDAALRKGARIEDLVKAGLAVRSEKTGRYHDPQWNRLVFPIFDAYGRAIAFGGRVLEDETAGPKYLNSPETPVYTKSRHLYGLYQGRTVLREKGQALLVEGYMDVIGCHQAGAGHAVAPLGTAFTKEQGLLLKRYVQEVILLFDPDEAGTRASWRSADVLVQADLFLRVARVPGGRDPDELILEKGLDALEETVRAARDVVDFWLENIARTSKNFDSLHERVRRAQELLAFLKNVPNEMLRREWVRKIALRLSLDEASLVRELHKNAAGGPAKGSAPAGESPWKTVSRGMDRRSPVRVRSLEEEILQLLCNHPEVWSRMHVSKELFHDERCRKVFQTLQEQWNARNAIDVAELAAGVNPEESGWLSSLLAEEKKFTDPHETLAHRLKRLEVLMEERERRSLEKEVLPMVEGKIPRDDSKISRYQSLTRALKGQVRAETKTPAVVATAAVTTPERPEPAAPATADPEAARPAETTEADAPAEENLAGEAPAGDNTVETLGTGKGNE